jgi:hypothetical protein
VHRDRGRRVRRDQHVVRPRHRQGDAADRDALRSELTAKRITHRETPLFELPLEDRGVHALLRSIDTPLTTVRTVAPSLEDAYIKVLARS